VSSHRDHILHSVTCLVTSCSPTSTITAAWLLHYIARNYK
jgi:hypothetical protein